MRIRFLFVIEKLGLGRERNTHEGVTHLMSQLCAKYTLWIFWFSILFNSRFSSDLVTLFDKWVKSEAFVSILFCIRKSEIGNVFKCCN